MGNSPCQCQTLSIEGVCNHNPLSCTSCCRRRVLFLGSERGTICKTLQPIRSDFQVS
ncbi:hypothetical protein BDR07DRAFT_1401820 [Suillus spraguei]|nr:hypothetical protein BDR07DRAFT_1401820 [Suillus spraguei]